MDYISVSDFAIRADRAQGAVRNIEINLTLLQPFGELSCLIDGDTKETH